jgi:hypothetical protein
MRFRIGDLGIERRIGKRRRVVGGIALRRRCNRARPEATILVHRAIDQRELLPNRRRAGRSWRRALRRRLRCNFRLGLRRLLHRRLRLLARGLAVDVRRGAARPRDIAAISLLARPALRRLLRFLPGLLRRRRLPGYWRSSGYGRGRTPRTCSGAATARHRPTVGADRALRRHSVVDKDGQRISATGPSACWRTHRARHTRGTVW